MMTTPDPTVLSLFGVAMSGMATAIGVLFRNIQTHIKRIESKLDECERDRIQILSKLAQIAAKSDDDEKEKNA